MATRVIVMYGGRIVEEAPVNDLFKSPRHPYTHGLLSCIPKMDDERETLDVIKGMVPSPSDFPGGMQVPSALPLRAGALPHGRPADTHYRQL